MPETSTHVALLRGINVGGQNVIRMQDLTRAIEAMGFSAVRTYIQSGNVLLATPETDRALLTRRLEHGLTEAFGYAARVVVRSRADLAATVAAMPPVFADATWKHNVCFLTDALDDPGVVLRFPLKPDIESVTYEPGVLFWSAWIETLTRSTMLKLSARREYQEMTVRNPNTTRKLLELFG
ncbi:MAG: DUF1697 domain-containing protein [Myxococcota bacterium]